MMKKIGKLLAIGTLSIVCAASFSALYATAKTSSSAIEIDVDYGDYDPRYLPVGLAGQTYPVFDCSAVCGEESVSDVSVFVYSPSGKILPVVGGRFRTETIGDYTIEYVAKRADETKKEKIRISVSDEERGLSYSFNENNEYSAYTGEAVFVYDGEEDGGIGVTEVKTTVEVGGEEVDLSEAKGGYYFVPETAGVYVLTYTLCDFVGREVPFVKEITVTDSENPIVQTPAIPLSIVIGNELVFPTVDGISYRNGEKVYLPVEVYYDDVEISGDMKIVAETVGNHTVKYVCEDKAKGGKTEMTFEVEAKAAEENDILIEKHLSLYNFASASEPDDNTYKLKAAAGDSAIFAFDSAIPLQFLSIEAGDEGASNYSSVTFKFTDSKNADDAAEITFDALENDFYIKYSEENSAFIDKNGDVIASLDYYSDGRKFEGFKSGKAYVSVTLNEVSGDSVVRLTGLGTKYVSAATRDEGTPLFTANSDYRSVLVSYMGGTVTIAARKAYDLFDSAATATLEITDPDKNVVYSGAADKPYLLKTDKYGTYKAKYVAKDKAGNETPVTCTIYCYDIIPPEIEVGKMRTTVKIGETISLPEAKFTDNNTEENKLVAYVYVLHGNNRKEMVEGLSYTFAEAGEYKVRYVAYDEFQNYTIAEFTVIAK